MSSISKFYTFRIRLEEDKFPSGETGYFVCIPELEHLGVATQGRTKEEAIEKIQGLLQLVLEDLREAGTPVPLGAALVSAPHEPLVVVA